jgi:hypothetical protein
VVLASSCTGEPLEPLSDLIVGIEPLLTAAGGAIEVMHRISRAIATEPADDRGSLERDSKPVANQD